MQQIELPAEEFDILKQTDDELVVYDKIVDKLYTFKDGGWKFPRGSRTAIIHKLTGLDLFGELEEE